MQALREQLRTELHDARRQTDALWSLLTPEALVERPIAERHRLIFYVGHLEVFDWSLLINRALARPSRNPEWEQRFAFGIDPTPTVGHGSLPTDAPADWPSTEAVKSWGQGLRDELDAVLFDAPWDGWLQNGWALRIAIEHRQMHAETLAYLFHRLPLELKRGPALEPDSRPAPAQSWCEVPAGVASLGRPRGIEGFDGWDNEYELHRVDVPAFRMQRFPVTNAEFLRFVEAGGYQDSRWWRPTDWSWLQSTGLQHPRFWARGDDGFRWKGMFSDAPLSASWPVWVSWAEANAYARWSGSRLPTEAEWHRAALEGPDGAPRSYPWGESTPEPGVHGNFGSLRFDPAPVDAFPSGRSAWGIEGLVGNGWQWTQSVFAPFDGFTPLPFYRGYSADFFDGRHFVLKGGGPRTAPGLLRRSFRNWFQPHYPHVHAGFHCVALD